MEYVTKCQYCLVPTGVTDYAWATEDVCEKCAAPMLEARAEEIALCEAARLDPTLLTTHPYFLLGGD